MHRAYSNLHISVLLSILISMSMLIPSVTYAECPSHKPITTVSFETKPVEYIRDYDTSELTHMHSGGQYTGTRVLGLTGGDVGVSFITKFEASPYAGLDNHYCLTVKSVNATFSALPKIYIAENFRRGTCEYAKVLAHELKHVKILKNAHNEFLPEYRKYLNIIASQIPVIQPILLSEVNLLKQQLIAYIRDDLHGYLQDIEMEIETRQKLLDSKEEYERIWGKCEKWDKRLKQ